MKYLLVFREGDKEIIDNYVKSFDQDSPEQLIVLYNKQVKIGIVGVRMQALYLAALGYVFYKRFNDSPVIFEDRLLSLTGEVELSGNGFKYITDPTVI